MSRWIVKTSVPYNRTNEEYEAFYAKVIKKVLRQVGIKSKGDYAAQDWVWRIGTLVMQQYEEDLPKKWLTKTKEKKQ